MVKVFVEERSVRRLVKTTVRLRSNLERYRVALRRTNTAPASFPGMVRLPESEPVKPLATPGIPPLANGISLAACGNR